MKWARRYKEICPSLYFASIILRSIYISFFYVFIYTWSIIFWFNKKANSIKKRRVVSHMTIIFAPIVYGIVFIDVRHTETIYQTGKSYPGAKQSKNRLTVLSAWTNSYSDNIRTLHFRKTWLSAISAKKVSYPRRKHITCIHTSKIMLFLYTTFLKDSGLCNSNLPLDCEFANGNNILYSCARVDWEKPYGYFVRVPGASWGRFTDLGHHWFIR